MRQPLLTLHTGTGWEHSRRSHHSCLAGRRGHGLVPWAEREQGESTEGIEGNMGRADREDSVGRQLPTHSQTAGNWGGWNERTV